MSTPAPDFYHDIDPGPVDMGRFLSRPRPYSSQGPVLAGHVDRNAALVADVARLYIPRGAKVIDLTWGEGTFWRDVALAHDFVLGNWFELIANDLRFKHGYSDDFRHTHFKPETFDIVVLDPPYKSGGGHSPGPMVDTYGLDAIKSDTPSGHGNAKVVWELYESGFVEAYRILKPNGLLWFKCQDFVESGKQHWFHIELFKLAQMLGFTPQDMFTLVQTGPMRMRHKVQFHSRRNVSHLWVMQKSDRGWATKAKLEEFVR